MNFEKCLSHISRNYPLENSPLNHQTINMNFQDNSEWNNLGDLQEKIWKRYRARYQVNVDDAHRVVCWGLVSLSFVVACTSQMCQKNKNNELRYIIGFHIFILFNTWNKFSMVFLDSTQGVYISPDGHINLLLFKEKITWILED